MALEKNNVVVVEHEFKTSVEKVFSALKDGRLFLNCGAWAASSHIDFKVGGKYHCDWGHHGSTTGEFTEIVTNKRVAFTWNFDEIELKSHVTIDLSARGENCVAKLRHEGFADAETAKMHDGGWVEGLRGFDDELVKHRVRLEREFLVPVEMLYQACSGAAFFSYLGATKENAQIDFRVGGSYRSELPNGNMISGVFKEIVKDKKIVYTWDSAPCGEPVEKSTLVTMEFGPWGDGGKNSYLALVHEGFVNDEATRAHHTGWNTIVRKVYDKVNR